MPNLREARSYIFSHRHTLLCSVWLRIYGASRLTGQQSTAVEDFQLASKGVHSLERSETLGRNRHFVHFGPFPLLAQVDTVLLDTIVLHTKPVSCKVYGFADLHCCLRSSRARATSLSIDTRPRGTTHSPLRSLTSFPTGIIHLPNSV